MKEKEGSLRKLLIKSIPRRERGANNAAIVLYVI